MTAVGAGRPAAVVRTARPRDLARKADHQFAKDHVLFPLLAGPSAAPCLVGNLTGNALRNIWAHTVVFCGHFPGDAQTFTEDEIEGETRGQWYERQIQGSANIDGGTLLHVLSGNTSTRTAAGEAR